MQILTHPSVVASTGALVVIAIAEVAVDLPWFLWTIWAVLAAIAVTQALRASGSP